ncbi:MAG: TIGR02302 family protein [Maritimibacter sp.]
MTAKNTLPEGVSKRLKWPLRLTLAGLWVERGARAFWPMGSILLLVFAWVSFGGHGAAPLWIARVFAVFVMLGGAAALLIGLRRFRVPHSAQALARLDDTLPGRPMAALNDAQATGLEDGPARALWLAHQSRMAAKINSVKAVGPHSDLAPRDPFGFRLMALTAGLMALLFGAGQTPTNLNDLIPSAGTQVAEEYSWEGWIEPPAYTGKPTLYLADQPPGTFEVPAGSRITLRLYGRIGAIKVREPWSAETTEDALPTRLFVVDKDGTLEIGADSWEITARADTPPQIEPVDELERALDGEMSQGFLAVDDYGVTSGQATFALKLDAVDQRYGLSAPPEPREDIAVDLPMPFRGDRSAFEERLVENFADHPWAELPVVLTFTAMDANGQTGSSAPMVIALPGRRFLDPLARALVEQRRDILWTAQNAPRVARVLRAISAHPEGVFPKEVQYLKLRTLVRDLEAEGFSREARDSVAQALWDLAVEIEDGSLLDAKERLRRAQERVAEAMRQGATPDEMSELMDELRGAMDDYMRQLAERAGEDGEAQADAGETMEMSQQDLQDLMNQIEDALREGRMEDAAQMLEMLRQLTENMQVAEGGAGEGQQSPGQQAMEGLSDTLRQQRDLSDETFGQQEGEDGMPQNGAPSEPGEQGEGQQGEQSGEQQNGQGQSRGENGEDGEGAGQQRSLSQRQRDLEGALDRQRQNLPGAGTEEGDAAREALDEAGRAMEDAANALEEGETSRALDRQADAMEAMREGMRNLDDAMRREAENQQGQAQGAQPGQPGGTERRDPLGRNPSSQGALGSDSPLEDNEDLYRRAQELLEELRRRSGETDRPQVERDYIERLLDQF